MSYFVEIENSEAETWQAGKETMFQDAPFFSRLCGRPWIGDVYPGILSASPVIRSGILIWKFEFESVEYYHWFLLSAI